MTDKERIIVDETITDTDQQRTCGTCNMTAQGGYLNCEYQCSYKNKKLKEDLICKTQECEKYEQVLIEIEEICRQLLDDDYIRSVAESLIDIISKTKENK